MSVNPLFRSAESLLRPRSIAIVGASDSGGAGRARRFFERLTENGRPVPLYLLNPKRTRLWGEKVYPDFGSLPQPIDLAIVLIPPQAVQETLAEGAAHGLKCALVYGGQFGEDGDAQGIARAQALKALCDDTGLRVCGPNCMGSISTREGIALYSVPRAKVVRPGSTGVVFQSSGTLQFWLEQATVRGLGVSYAITTGNEVDLDLADYISFLVDDPATEIIACLIEGVRRPQAFMAAAEKALVAKKPVLALNAGRSDAGREAARTHTGVLAGDQAAFDAACRKFGVIRCLTLDELVEHCLAFSQKRFPRGRRIAMVGYSGGLKSLFLDAMSEERAELAQLNPNTQARLSERIYAAVSPTNPVDCGADAALQPTKFGDACQIVCADSSVDVLMVQGHLPTLPGESLDAQMYRALAMSTDKPLIVFNRMAQNVSEEARAFQTSAGLQFLQGVPQAVRAAIGLAQYGEALRRGVPEMPTGKGTGEDLGGARLDRTLAQYGISLPATRRVASPVEAAAAAESLGYPVALKILSPDASHKTEVGGVALGLMSADMVREAAVAMDLRLRKLLQDARTEGFLVQQMVSGLEMIVGVRDDPQYGPLLVAGMGGVLVEVLKDVAVRLLPVDEQLAHEMLEELRGRALLGAFRGGSHRDVKAIVGAMAGLSRFYIDHRAYLQDVEINPLIVLAEGQGAKAVDVRLVARGS